MKEKADYQFACEVNTTRQRFVAGRSGLRNLSDLSVYSVGRRPSARVCWLLRCHTAGRGSYPVSARLEPATNSHM